MTLRWSKSSSFFQCTSRDRFSSICSPCAAVLPKPDGFPFSLTHTHTHTRTHTHTHAHVSYHVGAKRVRGDAGKAGCAGECEDAGASGPKKRLGVLRALLDDGLLDEREFQAQRAAIIASI